MSFSDSLIIGNGVAMVLRVCEAAGDLQDSARLLCASWDTWLFLTCKYLIVGPPLTRGIDIIAPISYGDDRLSKDLGIVAFYQLGVTMMESQKNTRWV